VTWIFRTLVRIDHYLDQVRRSRSYVKLRGRMMKMMLVKASYGTADERQTRIDLGAELDMGHFLKPNQPKNFALNPIYESFCLAQPNSSPTSAAYKKYLIIGKCRTKTRYNTLLCTGI